MIIPTMKLSLVVFFIFGQVMEITVCKFFRVRDSLRPSNFLLRKSLLTTDTARRCSSIDDRDKSDTNDSNEDLRILENNIATKNNNLGPKISLPPPINRQRKSQISGAFDFKRFILYNALAFALAIGANFLGMTSSILTQSNPQYFRSLKLDQLYSIGGFRRYVSAENQYEFIVPDKWLIDQSVLLSNINNRDLPNALRAKLLQKAIVQPDVAYAAPSSSDGSAVEGRENLSVIRSSVMIGFSLHETLGEPAEAADRLLSSAIAPPGSGKTYRLLSASEELRNGIPVYIFEYTVDSNQPPPSPSSSSPPASKSREVHQHTISVVASRGTELYTLTVTAPTFLWESEQSVLRTVTNSFSLSTGVDLPKGFY